MRRKKGRPFGSLLQLNPQKMVVWARARVLELEKID